jgi:anti-anti-sigma factor
MAAINIRIETRDGVHVVSFPDKTLLDTLAAAQFGREMHARIDEGIPKGLVIDFRNVRFLSSPTLGILVSLSRRARRDKARLVLSNVPREFAAVFKVTDLLKFFEVYDDCEIAIARLSAGDPPPTDG